MEALRQDDPRHFGPYTVLTRFRETASAVQYLVRHSDGDDLAVVTAARPALAVVPAFRRRFRTESLTAERLSGGWVQPPLDTPGDGDVWTAAAYVPALTLAEAIALAGPLPERAVRILGAGLAETLSRVHATGAVLQGLAPGTVLLAEDGPRLTAFGPLGAAASAEARAGGQLSVRLNYLTPEQVEGKDVGPASDLFVLGLLLAYAATGTTPLADGPADEAAARIAHAPAELGSVPAELRALIAGCLVKDPAERPSAGSVAAELALEGAAGLAKGGWLPDVLAAAVADQAARARALETPVDRSPAVAAEAGPAVEEEPRRAEPDDARPDRGPSGAGPEAGTPGAPATRHTRTPARGRGARTVPATGPAARTRAAAGTPAPPVFCAPRHAPRPPTGRRPSWPSPVNRSVPCLRIPPYPGRPPRPPSRTPRTPTRPRLPCPHRRRSPLPPPLRLPAGGPCSPLSPRGRPDSSSEGAPCSPSDPRTRPPPPTTGPRRNRVRPSPAGHRNRGGCTPTRSPSPPRSPPASGRTNCWC
ncbi:Serine/threonine-protein kinase AfsK [Streptomyces sp. ADI97-07]|uniref:serine/threonine protein kinase n=1 Tax=Streptomyces sp. ADI97-07 TaxID=1522762 RepID=UPI000F9AE849|nr:hypothetical protein [Streptomyces sp. ADI97-07]RPK81185.1 Serine/threonine-protein kinase AfsK [Streptomyces sp. ADI97-07]